MGYDLIVIGGGAAGICSAAAGAGLGARTLMVEQTDRLGGECSWSGCVPSKALLHLAAVADTLRRYGADSAADELAGTALATTRERTRQIAEETGTQAFLEGMGAEIHYGVARLTGEREVTVDGRRLRARAVVLATGSSPHVPGVPGLPQAGYLTNQNLFELDRPPAHLMILGAGPVGIEMAQAFRRLGSAVTVLTRGERILSKDDPELTDLLAERLTAEGIRIERGVTVTRVEREGELRRVHYRQADAEAAVAGDELLVATGRVANVNGLGLESVGVEPRGEGLALDAGLRTERRWLLAAGDIVGHHQFSHAAEEMARVAVRNALLPLGAKARFHWMPWCTFTEPELAHLGPTEPELAAQGIDYRVYRCPFADDDRARVDEAPYGLVKLLATPYGRLLGAHVLGPRAGEVLNELILGVKKGASVGDLAMTIHIYPSLGLAVQRAADHWFEDLMRVPLIRRTMTWLTHRPA